MENALLGDDVRSSDLEFNLRTGSSLNEINHAAIRRRIHHVLSRSFFSPAHFDAFKSFFFFFTFGYYQMGRRNLRLIILSIAIINLLWV